MSELMWVNRVNSALRNQIMWYSSVRLDIYCQLLGVHQQTLTELHFLCSRARIKTFLCNLQGGTLQKIDCWWTIYLFVMFHHFTTLQMISCPKFFKNSSQLRGDCKSLIYRCSDSRPHHLSCHCSDCCCHLIWTTASVGLKIEWPLLTWTAR